MVEWRYSAGRSCGNCIGGFFFGRRLNIKAGLAFLSGDCMQHTFTKYKNSSDGGTDVCRGNNWAGGVSARSAVAKCCLPGIRRAAPAFCSDSGTNGGRTHAPASAHAACETSSPVRFYRRGSFRRLQGVLVCCAALLFFGCGTALPPQDDEASANGTQNPSQKTYTVSGSIALSGAVPSAVSAQSTRNAVFGDTGGGYRKCGLRSSAERR